MHMHFDDGAEGERGAVLASKAPRVLHAVKEIARKADPHPNE